MSQKLIILASLLLTLGISSCDFIRDSVSARDKTEAFVQTMINEDYDQAVSLLAMEHEAATNVNIDTMIMGLKTLRTAIIENFGKELNYGFMQSEKTWSTIESRSTQPGTTPVLIEFTNATHFGVFRIIFDDTSGKILHIKMLDVKRPIPSMTLFWIFGILPAIVLVFNIYVIRKIKQSDLKKKWLKYVGVLFFNVPAISFSPLAGLTMKYLSFQILLGVSFSYMGYLNTAWTFGIPLGGMYWLWNLSKKSQNNTLLNDVDTPEKESDSQ